MIEIIRNYEVLGNLVWLYAGAFLLAIIFAMCSHEYAHAKVAYNCGDDTAKLSGRMTLNPLKHIDLLGALSFLLVGFGWANPVPINPRKFKDYRKGIFLTSIAGITTNFIICFFSCGLSILMMFFATMTISNAGELNVWYYILFFIHLVFEYSATVNFSLCLFNLLPIYPLDGFNIMQSLTKGTNKFVLFMRKYGTYILLALLLTTVLEIGMGYAVNFILEPIQLFWMRVLTGVV